MAARKQRGRDWRTRALTQGACLPPLGSPDLPTHQRLATRPPVKTFWATISPQPQQSIDLEKILIKEQRKLLIPSGIWGQVEPDLHNENSRVLAQAFTWLVTPKEKKMLNNINYNKEIHFYKISKHLPKGHLGILLSFFKK